SVVANDDGGESNLTYTWSLIGTPPASVGYSGNGTNSAKNVTATFSQAGSYHFRVTVSDTQGASTTSDVIVTVNQTLTSLVIAPGSSAVNENQAVQFGATGYDQFTAAMVTPPAIAWSSTGVGSINSTGLYSAPGASGSGSATITATG